MNKIITWLNKGDNLLIPFGIIVMVLLMLSGVLK